MGPLLPEWLGIAWTVALVLVAVSHLRHMADTVGQRRAWHACHVLMALGMVFMYVPATRLAEAVPASFWQLIFAAAGTLAALWALSGTGRAAPAIWLLTALDLGVMLLMWSGKLSSPLVLLSLTYLTLEASLWLLDIHRRLDGSTALVNWQLLSTDAAGGAIAVRRVARPIVGSARLLGELDITASMLVMTTGMAYMIVAMTFT